MKWILIVLSLIVSLALAVWVYRADKKRNVPKPWLTALLRFLTVFLTALMVTDPTLIFNEKVIQKPVLFFLQDNSQSIAQNLGNDSLIFHQKNNDLKSRLANDFEIVNLNFGDAISEDSFNTFHTPFTNISHALKSIPQFGNTEGPSAIILETDGLYNKGENPVFIDLPYQSSIYTVSIGDTTVKKDAKIGQVYSNNLVSVNSQWEVRVDVVAQNLEGESARLEVTENGRVLSSEEFKISSHPYDYSFSFLLESKQAGFHKYRLNLTEFDGEINTRNNHKDLFVEVTEEKKKILLAASAPHPDVAALSQALKGLSRYEVTKIESQKIPSTEGFDILILHQLPLTDAPLPDNIPTWLIMGPSSSARVVAQKTNLFRWNGEAASQNVFATVNDGFTAFHLDDNLKSAVSHWPPLYTNLNRVDWSPQVISILNQKGSNRPLWALKPGTTPLAITAGEGLWRWRFYNFKDEKSHDIFDNLVQQTISFLSTNINTQPFNVSMSKSVWSDQEAITFSGTLVDANHEQTNIPEAKLSIIDSSGKSSDFQFEKVGNTYALNIGILPAGNYSYQSELTYRGKKYHQQGHFVVDVQPIELTETGADFGMLYQLASNNNGAAYTLNTMMNLENDLRQNSKLKSRIIEQTVEKTLIDWPWFLAIIILVATTEWLLRKYWMAQ